MPSNEHEQPGAPQPDRQYAVAYRDNVALLLDVLDAVREETNLVGDTNGSSFWAAISEAVRAFATSDLLGESTHPQRLPI